MTLAGALELPGTASRTRLDRERGQLVGSRCAACGATAWPARAVCHRCGEVAELDARFGPDGTLLTHSRVWIARPPLEPPYVLGQVEVAAGPVVFVHVRALPEEARVPLPVRLAIAADADAVPRFWFEPR
jgi:uncharacterized OB-fold protein